VRRWATSTDETGLRVDGRLAWVHSASTDTDTLITVHDRRGRVAMDAAGVLPGFTGTAVHDCWQPYFGYPLTHALCNAHVVRELTGVWESTGQSWAAKLAATLERLNVAVHQARDGGQPRTSRRLWPQTSGRGQPARPAGDAPRGLPALQRGFGVPFTNNTAEQDIQPVKIRAETSGCLRTMAGAQAFCRLRSYLSTARKHHRDALDVLSQPQQGRPWLPQPAPG
jgi:transposase